MTSATWQRMIRHLPELAELADKAREAGQRGDHWWDTWKWLYEPLSKLVGPGSCGRFRLTRDFEVARRELCWIWGGIADHRPIPPWESEGETLPLPPAFRGVGGQRTFLDLSEPYN